jgi:hypothetical protein
MERLEPQDQSVTRGAAHVDIVSLPYGTSSSEVTAAAVAAGIGPLNVGGGCKPNRLRLSISLSLHRICISILREKFVPLPKKRS